MKNIIAREGFVFLCLFSSMNVIGQILEPAEWNIANLDENIKVGDTVTINFGIDLDGTWYIYSNDFENEGIGPIPTEIAFEPSKSFELVGEVIPFEPKEKYDDLLDVTYRYMDSNAGFKQRIKILKPNPVVSGSYSYLVCTLVDGKCIPGDDEFEVQIKTIE